MSATIEYLNLAGTLKRSLGATQVPGLGAPELQCSGSTQLCLCLQCAGGTGAAGIPDFCLWPQQCLLQPMISVSSRWLSQPTASRAWLSLAVSLQGNGIVISAHYLRMAPSKSA